MPILDKEVDVSSPGIALATPDKQEASALNGISHQFIHLFNQSFIYSR